MAKLVAILRWTGRGSIDDLEASVEWVLKQESGSAKVRRVGGSVIVGGPRPVDCCIRFEHMPGVAWVAAGYYAAGAAGLGSAARALASRYLRRGTRFSVNAEAPREGEASDLAGAITSVMLEEVKGARAARESSPVMFRAATDGKVRVLGYEVARGPGGTATGSSTAACLVSGGVHSSVLAWYAAISGFRVNLVHAQTSEESVRAAAKLYSELSNRMDPRWLSLTVLQGEGPAASLLKFSKGSQVPVFGGFTVARPLPAPLASRASAPLFLIPEEEFESRFRSLGLAAYHDATDWGRLEDGSYREKRFGGSASDVSGVLDGLA